MTGYLTSLSGKIVNLIVSAFIYYLWPIRYKYIKNSSDVDLVVFSKDRPFQLRSYLLSVLKNVSGIRSVSVLYSSTSSKALGQYEAIISLDCMKGVNFVSQNRQFKSELVKILSGIKSHYVMFAVDDMLVFDDIDVRKIASNLKPNSIFSLRLGRNIKYSYTLNEAQSFPEVHSKDLSNEHLCWKIKDGKSDFSYPMSVDMHIFPSLLICRLSRWLLYAAPNSYEGALSLFSYFIRDWNLVSFYDSKCVNLPINKVQNENDNRSCGGSLEQLMDDFDLGYCFDPHSFDKRLVISPHQVLEVKKIECSTLFRL